MVFSSKKIKNQIDSLLQEEVDSSVIHKKTNALKSFSDWLRRKSYMNDKDYRNTLHTINKTHELVQKHEVSLQEKVKQTEMNNQEVVSKKIIFITIALIMGTTLMVSSLYYLYNSKDNNSRISASAAEESGRVLHYRGKISSPSGKAIDIKTDVIFKLYYSAQDGAPLYIGSCIGEDGIIPNHLGYFSILLGSDCGMKKIPDTLFSKGNDIYLGVTLGNGEELKPRQLISKVSYAMNSDKLKGMTLGGNTSNIPFIDNQGRLLIDATSPTLQSSSGTFTLDGQSINIKTSEGTNGSIYFTPDFGGNTVIATGNLGVGTLNPTAKLDIKGDASISGNLQFTAENSFINLLNKSSLVFATSVAGNESLTPRLTLQSNGNIGIGASNPNYLLSTIQTHRKSSVVSFVNNAKEDEKETNVLRLGLGTAQGSTQAHFIQFYAGVTGDSDGIKVGGIKMNNGNVSYETTGADFAEFFYTKENIETGYIVSINKSGVTKSVQGKESIGVVSDTPGFIGNASSDTTNKVVVGLLGQINTYVSLENGIIHVGDKITVGTIPGVGRKANEGDTVIGIALEDSWQATSDTIVKLKIFVNPSLQKSQLMVNENGELTHQTSNTQSPNASIVEQNNSSYINTLTTKLIPQLTQTIIASLQNMSVTIQTLTTDSIVSLEGKFNRIESQEIISPVITSENISTTNLQVEKIAPKAENIEINLQQENTSQSNSNGFAKLLIKGMEDKVVTAIDEKGNATFSGELQANTVIAQDASISGTLVAREVKADNINSIENSVSNLQNSLLTNASLTDTLKQESQLLSSRLQEIQNELKSMNVSTLPDPTFYQDAGNIPATPTATFAQNQNSTLDNLAVANNTSLFTATITNSLTVGQIFQTANEIRSLTWNLNLSALSTVDFFNGQASIAKDGTLTTKGKIVAEGGIVTDTVDSKTGTVTINAETKTNGITLQNHAENTTQLTSSEHFNKYGVNTPASETAGEAAGQSYVPEQQKEIIIYNARINDKSLIYLTNTSPTITASANQLAVIEKQPCTNSNSSDCKPYFKVVSAQLLDVPTHFNWLIIN